MAPGRDDDQATDTADTADAHRTAEPTGPGDAHVRFASEAVDRFSDLIRFADAKAGAVILVLGLALSDLLQHAGELSHAGRNPSAWGQVATITFWTAGALAVATTISVVLTLFPKARPGEESPAHFADVARARSAEAYRTALWRLSDRQLADKVAGQAWQLARIADDKFTRIRYAYAFALAFLVAWALARVALAWST